MKDINQYVEKALRYTKHRCPWAVASDLGYVIHYSDMGKEIHGFHLKKGSAKIIYINDKIPSLKQEFVLAHELGHAMMHADQKLSNFTQDTFHSKEVMEREANIFAAILLFAHREFFSIEELSLAYEIEPEVLKDILGRRMGQKMFWEYSA